MFLRFAVVLALVLFNWIAFKNFELGFSVDNNFLTASLMSGTIHPTSRKDLNRQSFFGVESFAISVNERVMMKEEKDGSMSQFFIVTTRNLELPKSKPTRVERTYRDFKTLEVALNNNLRDNEIECPQLEKDYASFDASGGDDMPLNEKLTNIKRFCKAVAADPALHLEPFFDFFGVVRPEDEPGPRMSEVNVSDTYNVKNITEDKPHESLDWDEYENEVTVDFCPFFKVFFAGQPVEKEDKSDPNKKTYMFYSIVIKPLSNVEAVKVVEKRYSEFYDLALKMKTAVKARPPPLPPKLLLQDKGSLQKRAFALEEWLMVVMNEKIYYCSDLYNFVDYETRDIELYTGQDPVQKLIELFTFKFSVVDKNSVQNSDESFVVWEIKVEVVEITTQDVVDSYKMHHRFKEFDKMHQILSQKMHKFSKPLPSLPGKMGYLNIMSSSKLNQRQESLELYLRSLAEYPNIFSCICFRKFVGLDLDKTSRLLTKTRSYSAL